MKSVKETNLYAEVIKELNYTFGDVFIFNGFVVSEINKEVHFSWDNQASKIVEDVTCYLGTDGSDLIYISNRIHSYSIIASDWLKFFRSSFSLHAYYVVGHEKSSVMNTIFENMFFSSKIKKFSNLYAAIDVAKEVNYAMMKM